MSIWKIDVDNYTEENIEMLLECARMIVKTVGQRRDITITLVTKIMLGIFGNVPAFDTFFKRGSGTYTLSKGSLQKIAEFYQQNQEIFDRYKIYTRDFSTGQLTHRMYPKAKLIDMACFIEGSRYKPIG